MDTRPRKESFEVSSEKKPSGSHKDKVKAEVEKYIKKGQPTAMDLAELQKKYADDEKFIDTFLHEMAKRYHKIRKQARKVATNIATKYRDGRRPLHEILEKMMKYKSENKWSDAEYDEFRKELSSMLTGNMAMEIDLNPNLMAYRSRINRTLGYRYVKEEGINLKDTEHGVLNEILSMYQQYASLHKSIFMGSLMYEDCSLVAMTGEYKRDKHMASNYIHPILACMFLPKFDIFEIHMLYANFGSIIKSRYEKRAIVKEPDMLLFYDITTDPNDVVCEISSPITDLRNRYSVQIKLWSTVMQLRNGNYYEASPTSDFLSALNLCRNNLYDNADLAYNQDEGAILRRILSVFSLRPTLISTKPIYTIASFAAGPMNMSYGSTQQNFGAPQSVFPFSNHPVYTITSVPMITLQLPPHKQDSAGTEEPKDLRDALNQTIWINENKTIIPKEQSIIYSNEVLIFYVNRRIQSIHIRTFSNPIAFSQLPLTMSNFEKLNKYPILVHDVLHIRTEDEIFNLRSVVAVTETEIRQGEKVTNIITGSTGLIVKSAGQFRNIIEPDYLLYDPLGASLPVAHPLSSTDKEEFQGYITNKPISHINPYFTTEIGGVQQQSFHDRAKYAGTIFIYAKPSGYNTNQLITI